MDGQHRPDQPAGATSAPAGGGGAGTVRIRLDLAYDGTAFAGWARQPGQRTVQQTLEESLGRVLRLAEEPRLTVAGRTDAGVHARGQVAHADLPGPAWEAAAPSIRRGLSGVLPPDLRVRRAAPAAHGFDARFSALWRRYTYRVCDDPAGADPLRRHDTLWTPRCLDLDAMNEAARGCLGEHDFVAFCRPRAGASTVRRLLRLEWARAEPSVAVATVVADAFCHHMVRALIGTLLRVGEGARPPGWPGQVLAERARNPAVPVLPARGLCLEEIGYPPAGELSARAAQTRQFRGVPAADDTPVRAGRSPSGGSG